MHLDRKMRDRGIQGKENVMKKGLLVLLVMVLAATTLGWAAEEGTWQGFYVGLNAGLGRHEPNWSDNDYDWFGGTLTNPYNTILMGGTLGFNIQNGSVVIGFEADGAMGLVDHVTEYDLYNIAPYFRVTKTDKLESLFTARLRTGLALDNALLYFTAGAALPVAAHTWIERGDIPDSWQTFRNSNIGIAVGLGFEHRLGRVLSLKIEFLSIKNSPVVEPNLETPRPFKMSVDEVVGLLRLGFNFKF
jgi:outer membrane immunogenic protein